VNEERTVPQNLEAERAVLGSVLLDNSALNLVVEAISKDDFFSECHRIIFEKMLAISERGRTIDLVTLCEELSKDGMIEKAGGAAYLSALTDGVPVGTSIAVSEYSRIVKEKSILRRVLNSSHNVISRFLKATDDPGDILELAQSQLFEIAQERTKSGFQSIREITRGEFASFDSIMSQSERHTGLDTGLSDLDSITCGLQKQDLIIAAGPTSVGKTALALAIACHASVHDQKKVGIFSLEMSKAALIVRLICMEAEIDSHRLRTGFCLREEYNRATLALGRLVESQLFIDDSAGQTIPQIRAKARRLKAEKGLDLLIVDYLQLVAPGKKCENRTQEVSYISRSLKGIAKELKVPVLALSQLSRAPDKRKTTRPMLSDLRESGTIEQDADVVLFIWRNPRTTEDDRDEAEPRGIELVLILAKQRNGPTGDVSAIFMKPYAKFVNMEHSGYDADAIHVP